MPLHLIPCCKQSPPQICNSTQSVHLTVTGFCSCPIASFPCSCNLASFSCPCHLALLLCRLQESIPCIIHFARLQEELHWIMRQNEYDTIHIWVKHLSAVMAQIGCEFLSEREFGQVSCWWASDTASCLLYFHVMVRCHSAWILRPGHADK